MFLFPKVVLILANSEDPDEIYRLMRHFIWVFTVVQRTRLYTRVQEIDQLSYEYAGSCTLALDDLLDILSSVLLYDYLKS